MINIAAKVPMSPFPISMYKGKWTLSLVNKDQGLYRLRILNVNLYAGIYFYVVID